MDKKYWKYSWLVYRGAWKSFQTHFGGWKKIFEPIAVAILSGICSFIAMYKFQGRVSQSDLGVIVLSIFGGPLLYLGYLLIAELIFTPYHLYREKLFDANKLTFKDIEVESFKFPEGSGYGVGLRLISDKQKNSYVTFVCAKIWNVHRESIDIIDKSQKINSQLPILVGSGSIFKKGDVILNRCDNDPLVEVSAIPIANWKDEKAWIVSEDGNGVFFDMDKDIIYRVTISLDGYLNYAGKFKLEGCGVWCDLQFCKNKKGNMEVFIKRVVRRPEYEI